MFTVNQIQTAHGKVKSGADFPAYIQELKAIGVVAYVHFVADGHIRYRGNDELEVAAAAKWPPKAIAANGDKITLEAALSIHQAGQTDYPTFCKQAAEAGVEQWIVDISEMVCTYYDQAGKAILAESIPTV